MMQNIPALYVVLKNAEFAIPLLDTPNNLCLKDGYKRCTKSMNVKFYVSMQQWPERANKL